MARAFWSGHLQISLVSFGIEMFPATEAKGEIHFHQLNRKTGERIKHQNVSSDERPLEKDEIVKGYEYSKGQYVMIEPEDIENLRIPSRQTLDIATFVDVGEVDPRFFEKPYFVVPDDPAHPESFLVVRKALQVTKKVGLGKVAFGGREHLIAISAPRDDAQLGMMGYVMRYSEELRAGEDYFSGIKSVAIDGDQLALAEELIKRKTSKFDASKFTDEYEKALRAMVEAKVNHAAVKPDGGTPKTAKVLNLMDALRRSVGENSEVEKKKAPATAAAAAAKVTVMKRAPAAAKATKAAKPKASAKRRRA